MVNPEELLSSLKDAAKSSKTIKSLEAINITCLEMLDKKVEITYSSVAAFGEAHGVPKAQSIRNKSGEPYRLLIDSWKKLIPKSQINKTSKYPKSYEWIGSINDASIRFLVDDLKARATSLQAELDRVKSITTLEIDLRDVEYESNTNKFPFKLTNSEFEALKSAIDEGFLKREGWSSDQYGRIKNDKNREMYKVGYMSAIKKILSSHEL